jgi:hypothetical protein
MLAYKWGLKTLYYSLISKQGSKVQDEEPEQLQPAASEDEDSCESCKL